MKLEEIGLVLLASGLSTRFGGDKLLAPLRGAPLLSHAAGALKAAPVGARLAVAGAGQKERQALLRTAGWELLLNPAPEAGQGAALALAARAVAARPEIEGLLVLLGDMPLIPDAHLEALAAAMAPGLTAVVSVAEGVRTPPALFARSAFPALAALSREAGARQLLQEAEGVGEAPLDPSLASDIDTPADLARLEAR